LWNVDVGASETAKPALRRALLRPVDLPELAVDRDPDAPAGLVAPVLVAAAGLDKRLDMRAVEIGAHHPHALAVAPIEPAPRLIEVKLLGQMRDALRNDDPAVASVQIGALDRAVVQPGHAHVGPIDMARLGIDDDTVGEVTTGDDRHAVCAV